jgi:hypothetical protein
MVLFEIMIKDEAAGDVCNSASRWTCQQQIIPLHSSALILMNNAYLDEILETCYLYLFDIWCHV